MSGLAARAPTEAALGGGPGGALPLVSDDRRNPVDVYLAGLSESSRTTMERCLVRIARRAQLEDPRSLPWERMRPGDAATLRQGLEAAYAPSTANLHLSAFRGVIKAAFDEGWIGADQKERLIAVKDVAGSRLPPGKQLSYRELVQLFEAAAALGGVRAVRESALLAVLYGGALRVHEPCKLVRGDYRGEVLRVTGKGKKQRDVPLPSSARAALDAWLEHLPDDPAAALFPAMRRGGLVLGQALSVAGATKAVLDVARRAGVALTTHDLRRSAISELFEAGTDIPLVARYVGHSDVRVTASYDRRPAAKVKAAVERGLHVPYGGKRP